jgi:hypothetical protein
MDLFRYSAVNQRDYSGGRDGLASFFSVDGSVMLTPLHNAVAASGTFDGQDLADWASGIIGDAFGPGGPGSPGTVSATDLRVMDILGWTPAAAQQANFTIADLTTSATVTLPGDPYAGPVSGLEHQYVNITPDNLNIASLTPNAFIHSGFGTDGINVSQANGNNILDGSAGSNFLIGGTGTDTFYMDDREPTSPVFSTIVNFHAGDNATVWGCQCIRFQVGDAGKPGCGRRPGPRLRLYQARASRHQFRSGRLYRRRPHQRPFDGKLWYHAQFVGVARQCLSGDPRQLTAVLPAALR